MSGAKKNLSVEYRKYLVSSEWRKKRIIALRAAGHKCTDCGSIERLEVHHLTYKRLGSELLSDLCVLCRKCHQKRHDYGHKVPAKKQKKKKKVAEIRTKKKTIISPRKQALLDENERLHALQQRKRKQREDRLTWL